MNQKQKDIQNHFDVSVYWTAHKEGSNTELYADIYSGRHASKKQAMLSGRGRCCEVEFQTVNYSYYAEQAMGKAKNDMLDAIAEKLSR